MLIGKNEYEARKAALKKRLAAGTTVNVVLDKRQSGGGEHVEEVQLTADKVSVVKYLRGSMYGMWDGADNEKGLFTKALASNAGTQGGFTVPNLIVEAIVPALREVAVVRGLPGVTITPVLEAGEVEYNYEISDPTVTWGTEGSTISEQSTTELYGKRTLSMKRVHCLVYVDRELIRGSKINFEQNIRQRMGSALGLEEDSVLLQGLGGTQPLGIYYDPRVVSTDLSGAVDADNIRDAEYNVRLNQAEVMAWVGHPRTATDLSKLKDANGRPIFPNVTGPGVTGRGVMDIFGKPLKQTTKVGITGYPDTNETYLVGGDWQYQVIGDGPMELESSTVGGDAFAKHLVGIKLVKYVGGLRTQPGAFVVIKGIQAAT